jgi:cleavage and polyadenylation specificity factor subunit 3
MASVATAPPAGKRPASGGREGDQMVITPLGAGSEVGRSCVHMTFKGRTVLVLTSSEPYLPSHLRIIPGI